MFLELSSLGQEDGEFKASLDCVVSLTQLGYTVRQTSNPHTISQSTGWTRRCVTATLDTESEVLPLPLSRPIVFFAFHESQGRSLF